MCFYCCAKCLYRLRLRVCLSPSRCAYVFHLVLPLAKSARIQKKKKKNRQKEAERKKNRKLNVIKCAYAYRHSDRFTRTKYSFELSLAVVVDVVAHSVLGFVVGRFFFSILALVLALSPSQPFISAFLLLFSSTFIRPTVGPRTVLVCACVRWLAHSSFNLNVYCHLTRPNATSIVQIYTDRMNGVLYANDDRLLKNNSNQNSLGPQKNAMP